MAKISRYEQNQLQSELVGTPGVDTSTAQIFNVAAQGFGDVATQMRYAAAQKQREVAAATKALATADRQARIGSIALSKAATWNNVDNELRAKHQWDTSGGLDALQERISQDLTQTVQGVSDPLERAELTKALQVQQAAQIKSFSDWQTGRIVPNATANAKAMADSQIQLMSAPPADPTDPNQWWGKEALQPMIDTFNRNSNATYQTIAGPAATAEQRKVLAEGFKQRLAAYNLTMPEVMSKQGKEYTSDMLGAAVEAVRKTGLVDPEDLNKFANEQEHIRNEEVQAATAQQTLALKLNDVTLSIEASKFLNSGGTPTVAKANAFRSSNSYKNASPAQRAKFEIALSKATNPDKQAAADSRRDAQTLRANKEAARLVGEQNDAQRLRVVSADVQRLDALSMSILSNQNKYNQTKDKKYLLAAQQDLEKYEVIKGNIELIADPKSVATSKYKTEFGTVAAGVDLAHERVKHIARTGVPGDEAKKERERKTAFDTAWYVSNPYNIDTDKNRYVLWNKFFTQKRDYAYFKSKPAYIERVLSGEKIDKGLTVARRDALTARNAAMADVDKAMTAQIKTGGR